MITPGPKVSLVRAATFAAVLIATTFNPAATLVAAAVRADATDNAEATLIDSAPAGFVLAPVGDGGVTGPVTERRLQLLSFNEDQARIIEEADPAGYARVWTSDADNSVIVAVAVLVQSDTAADTLVERFADAVSTEVAIPFEIPEIAGARGYRVEGGTGSAAVAFSYQATVFLLSGIGTAAGEEVMRALAVEQSAKALAGPGAGVSDGGREADDDPSDFRPVIASVGAVLAIAVFGGAALLLVRGRAEG